MKGLQLITVFIFIGVLQTIIPSSYAKSGVGLVHGIGSALGQVLGVLTGNGGGGLAGTGISNPIGVTVNNSTTLQPPVELICGQNQPAINDAICATVCGSSGGTCFQNICYCNCKALVDQTLSSVFIENDPLNKPCTPSANLTANTQCNNTCFSQYQTPGTMCSISSTSSLGINVSLNNTATEICTCGCDTGTVVEFNPNSAVAQVCNSPGSNIAICQFVCGPFGGGCEEPGVCFCNCPPQVNGQPLLTPNTTNMVPQGCPPELVVKNASEQDQQLCNYLCNGGGSLVGTQSQVCSIIPSQLPSYLSSSLNTIPGFGSLYQNLVNQTTLCVCLTTSEGCDSTLTQN